MDERVYKAKMGRGVKDTYGSYNVVSANWQAPQKKSVKQSYATSYAKAHGGALGIRTSYVKSSTYDPIT